MIDYKAEMTFSTCIKEVTVFFFQTGVKRKAAPPALQFQPNSAGGKRAKVDATGQQVKNAGATLNELKQGLVYELVETKGKLFVGRGSNSSLPGTAHAPCYVYQVVVNNQTFKGEGR